jgi:hypothetical protein
MERSRLLIGEVASGTLRLYSRKHSNSVHSFLLVFQDNPIATDNHCPKKDRSSIGKFRYRNNRLKEKRCCNNNCPEQKLRMIRLWKHTPNIADFEIRLLNHYISKATESDQHFFREESELEFRYHTAKQLPAEKHKTLPAQYFHTHHLPEQ